MSVLLFLFHRTSESPYLEILGNFTNETLEGELANEELSRLLVAPDFTKGDCARTESVGLLYATSRCRCRLTSGFRGKLWNVSDDDEQGVGTRPPAFGVPFLQ
jgi:hypothetical protein